MSTAAIRAGKAFVELFASDSALVRVLAKARQSVIEWARNTARSAKGTLLEIAAAAGSVVAPVKLFAKIGSEIKDMADRTGLGVEAIQELGYAAKMTGASIEDVEVAVKTMQKAIAEAEDGSKQASDAMAAVGLSAADLKGITPEEQLAKIAGGLAAITDPAHRTAAALGVFGKSGTKLVPMMAEGKAGLDKFSAAAREAGLVMSADDVAAADALGDAMDTVWEAIKRAGASIGKVLAPAATAASTAIMQAAGWVGRWISENKGIVIAAALAAGAFVAFKVAVLGLAVTMSAILSPITLVVAAVAGVGFALLKATGGWATFKADSLNSWDAIVKAIAAGNIGDAVKVAVAQIKTWWAEGWAWLEARWVEFTWGFLDAWDTMIAGAKAPFVAFMNWIADRLSDLGMDDVSFLRSKDPWQEAEKSQKARADASVARLLDAEKRVAAAREELLRAQMAATNPDYEGKWGKLGPKSDIEARAFKRGSQSGREYRRVDIVPESMKTLPSDYKASTVGTFSGGALWGLASGGGYLEKIEKNTRVIAKNTEKKSDAALKE